MSVPSQILSAAATGPRWKAYRVANAAAPKTVIPSRTIHSLDVPRAIRVKFAAASPADSGCDANEVDPLSRNSDVAITFSRPQKLKTSRKKQRQLNCKSLDRE
jgi:hypothetical protein